MKDSSKQQHMLSKLTKCLASLTLLVTSSVFGQVPHLEGIVKISVNQGTIDADLSVTNLPPIEDYSIRLNKGLNIEYFRNLADSKNYGYNVFYDQDQSSESLQYFFPSADKKRKDLPEGFKVKYTGKFPVIKDTLRANDWGDWKGNMAFNGQTFRASESSAWYPVLYDIKNDLLIDKYTYNIKVECVDGTTIYINGSAPQKRKVVQLSSAVPVALLVFVGNYNFVQADKMFVLNGGLHKQALSTLTEITSTIVEFYESKLSLDYGSSIVYLNSKPVSRKNAWMFVTFPTVAVIGNDKWSLEGFFDEKTHQLKNKDEISFIAHELGHYYFGTYFTPNSTLKWLFLEGVTDYISLQATKQILGEESYDAMIRNYISQVSNESFVSLDKINQTNEIGEMYRYRYVPLLFTAIEKEVGEDNMWKWLILILGSKNATSDYSFFRETLISIVGQTKFVELQQKYITGSNAKENIIATIIQ